MARGAILIASGRVPKASKIFGFIINEIKMDNISQIRYHQKVVHNKVLQYDTSNRT